ncbi:MAG: GGDEF domain-containing protein [bacterium]
MIVKNITGRSLEVARQVVNTAKGVARHLTAPSAHIPIVSPPNMIKIDPIVVHPLQTQIEALGQQLAAAQTRIKELEAQVGIDAFTGFLTKAYGLSVLEAEISRSNRNQRPISIVVFDIDHFKNVNDTYGHIAGDQVLKALAEIIRTHTRANVDKLIRFGGEEFIAVLPETDENGANIVATKIRELVETHTFIIDTNQGTRELIKKTISGGVAQLDKTVTSAKELVKKADERLYYAKTTGRNRICGQSELAAA